MRHSDVIKGLLESIEQTRDDDVLLYSLYVSELGYNIFMPLSSFLSLVSNGTLVPMSYVERIRRRVQEKNIGLRGKLYEARQKRQKLIIEKTKEV